MRHFHSRSFRAEANTLRCQFLQGGGLPFTDILTDQLLSQALAGVGGWLDRIFSPLVTQWVFLGQVLSADHSCRAAVDHLVVWKKPTSIRSVDRRTYNALPDAITIREARFRVDRPGFRTRSVVVVTTLLDPTQATREELAELYRARWHAELDLRSLVSAMQMGELRGKTPEMVRKEVWAHVLADNLVRTVMAQAAAGCHVPPRSISFTGAMQTLEAFQPFLAARPARDAAGRRGLYRELLRAIAAHRVADRPDRFEPRLKKRRKDYCGWFTEPRAELKRKMAKGVNKK